MNDWAGMVMDRISIVIREGVVINKNRCIYKEGGYSEIRTAVVTSRQVW